MHILHTIAVSQQSSFTIIYLDYTSVDDDFSGYSLYTSQKSKIRLHGTIVSQTL